MVREAFVRASTLQDEKIQLVNKACHLLDRYVKRLDVKIRDLQQDGSIPLDPQMPTLLRASPGNLVPSMDSGRSTGVSTPLQPISANSLSNSQSIAQVAALNRLAASGVMGRMPSASVAQQIQQATIVNPATQTGNPRIIRDISNMSGGPDAKRRRLNGSLGPLPIPTPNQARHSSLGPGTPKATTPSTSRAGSVGPSGRPGLKKTTSALKKPGPLSQSLNRDPRPSKKSSSSQKHKKGSRRSNLASGSRLSPSTTTGASESQSSSDSESVYSTATGTTERRTHHAPRPHSQHHPPGHNTNADGDVDMDEASDDTKYCYCHDVSHGDMIACDNADCKIQWFHWTCAGIESEPQGEWLCRECRKMPREKIRKQS